MVWLALIAGERCPSEGGCPAEESCSRFASRGSMRRLGGGAKSLCIYLAMYICTFTGEHAIPQRPEIITQDEESCRPYTHIKRLVTYVSPYLPKPVAQTARQPGHACLFRIGGTTSGVDVGFSGTSCDPL